MKGRLYMTTTEINLLALKQNLLETNPIDLHTKHIIDHIIWNFDQKVPEHYEFIMVLGNPTCVEIRLPAAIRLWNQNKKAHLILCGGVVSEGKPVTEAERMRDACLAAEVPSDRILLENHSYITRENIEFAAPLVHKSGITNPTIVVVSSPTHMRRVQMNLDRFANL